MATYTENYNLEKPAQSDLYNIDVFNENADKIDEALGDKAENQSLAPIESSATASRNYSVGQQFVYNGLLYEATAAIASGGTITPGSNCARTTVAEELSALNDSLPKRIASATKSSSVTLNFPMNSLNVIWTAGNSANTQTAVFSVNATSNGSLSIVDIRTATEVSHTTNGYNATITNSNTGNGLRICCINLYGDFPTEV